MNEKIILLFILLTIGILLLTGCSTVPKEFTLNIKYVTPQLPFTTIEREKDELLKAFSKKDQLLLKAIEKEEGEILEFAPYLNLYNQISNSPTAEGFRDYMMSGPQYHKSGGSFLKKWWERVLISYDLYLEMEGLCRR